MGRSRVKGWMGWWKDGGEDIPSRLDLDKGADVTIKVKKTLLMLIL